MAVKCRVCDSEAAEFAHGQILNRYTIAYYRCGQCGHVQTESPYWLADAYRTAIVDDDTGLVGRNLHFAQFTTRLIQAAFNPQKDFLDYGGGYGLFVRLMRDAKLNFFRHNKYCQNLFALGLDRDLANGARYDLVTAFEVFEHFIFPAKQVEEILGCTRSILLSTEVLPFNNPPKPDEWHYYAPAGGQHIAFYTRGSPRLHGGKHGLKLYTDRRWLHLMTDKTCKLAASHGSTETMTARVRVSAIPIGQSYDVNFGNSRKRNETLMSLQSTESAPPLRSSNAASESQPPGPSTVPSPNSRKLVFLRTDSIGDNILAAGMLPAIARHYPGVHVTVTCADTVAPIYEACPSVNAILPFDKTRALRDRGYQVELAAQIRGLKADILLNTVYSRDALGDFLALNSGAGQIIGHRGDLSNIDLIQRQSNDRIYHCLLPSPGTWKPELERNKDFLRGLGIDDCELVPTLWLTREDRDSAAHLLARENLNPAKTIILFASAQYEIKTYPFFGQALGNVCREQGLSLLAIGSAAEAALNQQSLQQAGRPSANLCGMTSLRQSAALIQACRLAVGVDTPPRISLAFGETQCGAARRRSFRSLFALLSTDLHRLQSVELLRLQLALHAHAPSLRQGHRTRGHGSCCPRHSSGNFRISTALHAALGLRPSSAGYRTFFQCRTCCRPCCWMSPSCSPRMPEIANPAPAMLGRPMRYIRTPRQKPTPTLSSVNVQGLTRTGSAFVSFNRKT